MSVSCRTANGPKHVKSRFGSGYDSDFCNNRLIRVRSRGSGPDALPTLPWPRAGHGVDYVDRPTAYIWATMCKKCCRQRRKRITPYNGQVVQRRRQRRLLVLQRMLTGLRHRQLFTLVVQRLGLVQIPIRDHVRHGQFFTQALRAQPQRQRLGGPALCQQRLR